MERVRAALTRAKEPDEGVCALALKARADDIAALKEKAKARRQPGGRKKACVDGSLSNGTLGRGRVLGRKDTDEKRAYQVPLR